MSAWLPGYIFGIWLDMYILLLCLDREDFSVASNLELAGSE